VSKAVRLSSAAGLVVLGLIWLVIDKPVEGRTLVRLSYNHGITEADLLSLLLFFVAGLLVLGTLRRGGSGTHPRG
jgi:hypothetical protein